MCDIRQCKVCKEEKNIKEFRLHKGGYYYNTCKKCLNDKRRENSGQTYINGEFIAKKKCNKCSTEYLRTEENFSYINKKGGYRLYKKICKNCEAIYKELYGRKKQVIEDNGKKSICIKCKEEKLISQFYKQSSGYTSSYCISCESDRKKEHKRTMSEEDRNNYLQKGREFYYKQRDKQAFLFYRKFDYERNLENNVTPEYIKDSLSKSCSYCGFKSTGLDRTNNNLGHTIENTIPCCVECNSARMSNFTYEEMKIIGQSIREIKIARLQPINIIEQINELIA